MSHYGKFEYWEERYTRDTEQFDWYQTWSGVKDIITQFISPESNILNVGCGNSRLSEEMFDEGYQNITNIDLCPLVTKAMQEKYKDKGPTLKYELMDARQMTFKDGVFDCVIDKGTLDSILCGESSVANARKMLSEIYRVLAPGGVYIAVSYGTPEHRLHYLKKPYLGWKILAEATIYKPTLSTTLTVSEEEKNSASQHYVYICRKEPVEN